MVRNWYVFGTFLVRFWYVFWYGRSAALVHHQYDQYVLCTILVRFWYVFGTVAVRPWRFGTAAVQPRYTIGTVGMCWVQSWYVFGTFLVQ